MMNGQIIKRTSFIVEHNDKLFRFSEKIQMIANVGDIEVIDLTAEERMETIDLTSEEEQMETIDLTIKEDTSSVDSNNNNNVSSHTASQTVNTLTTSQDSWRSISPFALSPYSLPPYSHRSLTFMTCEPSTSPSHGQPLVPQSPLIFSPTSPCYWNDSPRSLSPYLSPTSPPFHLYRMNSLPRRMSAYDM